MVTAAATKTALRSATRIAGRPRAVQNSRDWADPTLVAPSKTGASGRDRESLPEAGDPLPDQYRDLDAGNDRPPTAADTCACVSSHRSTPDNFRSIPSRRVNSAGVRKPRMSAEARALILAARRASSSPAGLICKSAARRSPGYGRR